MLMISEIWHVVRGPVKAFAEDNLLVQKCEVVLFSQIRTLILNMYS